MSIQGLTDQAAATGQWRRENPEGISVVVVTDEPAVAQAVAPMLAERLYPDRRIGAVLFVNDEPQTVTGIEVVVQDRGPR